ncbi:RNA ligase [Streptomyces sp. NPDC007083]|uniref:RNA ligase n=1 Tax=Streptomyces sp. NPDC007083 TaxID=3156913 RepID=UPI0033D0BEC2
MSQTPARTLADLFAPTDLKTALANRFVTIRHSSEASGGEGLRILNYSDRAVCTTSAWDNPAVRACRGLIVDPDDQLVARPWVKFFNHNQSETVKYGGPLDLVAPVEVTDKLDGSLGIVFRDAAGELRVATRGSFESEQALHATKVLRTRYPETDLLTDVTPLVEILFPANRIVVDYDTTDDLVLLGGVEIATGRYLGPDDTAQICNWTGPKTEVFGYATLADALAAEPRPGMEGLCVRFLDEDRITKIKQSDYIALHRIVTGLSEKSVWEHAMTGKSLDALLEPLPDELHAWTRDIWSGLWNEVDRIHIEAQRLHIKTLDGLAPDWSRKDYAMAAQSAMAPDTAHLRPYLFMLLDGRDPRPAVLKSLKPRGDQRARTVTEDVA